MESVVRTIDEKNEKEEPQKKDSVNQKFNIGDFNKVERFTDYRTSWSISLRGQKIFGILHRPQVEQKVPFVLFSHGFAGSKVGVHRIYERIAHKLALQGIASLRFDYRGCGDSEGDLLDMRFEDHLLDYCTVFENIVDETWIDRENVAILGRSMGGMVATIAQARLKKKLKAICLVSPVYDASPWLGMWSSRKDGLGVSFAGELISLDFLKEFFHSTVEGSIQKFKKIPFFHVHSEEDDVVPFAQKKLYEKHWQDSKELYTFLHLEKSNHSFSNIQERKYTIAKIVDWFCAQLFPLELKP